MSDTISLPNMKSVATVKFERLQALCRKRCRKGPALIGLDPLSAMRCRALLYAHTAIAAYCEAQTEKQLLGLERLADAFLSVHDQFAGLRWYSLSSTVRAARRDTIMLLGQATTRAELRRISDALVAEENPRSKLKAA